jgi:hypothetical protein
MPRVDTTALYTQVATNVIRAVKSPLDPLTLLTAKRPEPPPMLMSPLPTTPRAPVHAAAAA